MGFIKTCLATWCIKKFKAAIDFEDYMGTYALVAVSVSTVISDNH